ncbi:hypothetical protein [Lysobacter enzymogenes]|uniref:Uncharacterized protein n=1 Tax=Lysobacter enzymogenes TaxID=69 RepID=A0AAU9ADB3_LYSEN|nr:hypothetical protein [Lysobacter enzymogenes]BAV96197.1 hypothetical protein LEN_0710 [Lysobacter enzymogenes]
MVFRAFIGVFVVSWICTFAYKWVSPTAREGREIIESIAGREVVSITADPVKDLSLVDRPLVIRDPKAIRAIVQGFESIETHSPNHPDPKRIVALRLQLRDRQIRGELFDTKNEGVLFYYCSESGWVFGTYRMPKGAAIFEALEREIQVQRGGS